MSAPPNLTPRAEADRAERTAREAAALRRNLALRKQQSRQRSAEPKPACDGAPPETPPCR